MRTVDWVVVPSTWWENAPLVIHEARAARRPVICSGIGGMAEMVEDGISGLHVPPGDAAALAETMLLAAADADRWDHMARALTPASHEAFVEAHLGLYRSVCDRVAA
jgi:glycosyltransferase involved in cell wall biosynthesis